MNSGLAYFSLSPFFPVCMEWFGLRVKKHGNKQKARLYACRASVKEHAVPRGLKKKRRGGQKPRVGRGEKSQVKKEAKFPNSGRQGSQALGQHSKCWDGEPPSGAYQKSRSMRA